MIWLCSLLLWLLLLLVFHCFKFMKRKLFLLYYEHTLCAVEFSTHQPYHTSLWYLHPFPKHQHHWCCCCWCWLLLWTCKRVAAAGGALVSKAVNKDPSSSSFVFGFVLWFFLMVFKMDLRRDPVPQVSNAAAAGERRCYNFQHNENRVDFISFDFPKAVITRTTYVKSSSSLAVVLYLIC